MAKQTPSKQLTRRLFLTVGVIAASGCSGDASGDDPGGVVSPTPTPSPPSSPSPPSPPPSPTPPSANRPPTWTTLPTVTFTLGIPSTFSVASFVTDPDGDALTLTHSGALPNGVTFDSANKRFVYDGSGAAQASGGHVLTADDLK